MLKKLFNRCAALILALCCVFSAAVQTSVFAAGSILTDKMILDLEAFEILSGMEDGELHLERGITRAQLCRVVATVMQTESGYYSDKEYSDVPKDHWAYSYISALSGMGLLNGYTDGTFHPEDPVKYKDAAKILVVMLGYALEAERSGGYPDGYLSVASRIGVAQGVGAAIDAELTREQAMRMIYNCLDAKRMVQSLTSSNELQLEAAEETYRDLLLGDDEDGLMKIKGVVTANREMYLDSATPDMDDDKVEIDGVIYWCGNTDISKYFGMTVNAYVKANPSSSYGIVRKFDVDKTNSSFKVHVKDISELSEQYIKYTDENGKNQSKRMAIDVQYLYNGRLISGNDISKVKIEQIKDAIVTCITNTDSKNVNIVMIDEYASYPADRVSAADKRIYLSDNYRYNSYKYIDADDENKNRVVTIRDKDGNLTDIENIKEGDIVTTITSPKSDLIRIIVSDEKVSGRVDGYDSSEGEITIDGTVYDLEKNADTDDILGRVVTASLNCFGEVAYIDKDASSGNYDGIGAIVEVKRNYEDDNVQLRLAVPGKIVDDIEDNDSDDPASQDIPAISAKNDSVVSLFTASEVSFDKSKYANEELINEIEKQMRGKGYIAVTYNLDKDGLVKRIDSLEVMPQMPESYYLDGTQKTVIAGEKVYNAYEKSFGGKANGAFGIDESTLGICVPTNSVSSTNDYLAKIEMNNSQVYNVAAYKYNKNTHCPEIVVFSAEMHWDTNGEINDKSKIALVKEKFERLNDDGDTITGVDMLTENGMITAEFSENTNSSANFDALQRGDLIFYSLDNEDKLDGYERIIRTDPIPQDMHDKTISKEVYVGKIQDASYNHVSDNLNKWVDSLVILAQGAAKQTYEVPITNGKAPVYIFDTTKSGKEQFYLGTSEDFLSEQEKAVVVSRNNKVKAVVIIK